MGKKRRQPVSEREVIEVLGVPRRLLWIAQNRPEILVKRIEGGHPRSQAYWSVLAQAGWPRIRIMANCEELGVDPGIMQQM